MSPGRITPRVLSQSLLPVVTHGYWEPWHTRLEHWKTLKIKAYRRGATFCIVYGFQRAKKQTRFSVFLASFARRFSSMYQQDSVQCNRVSKDHTMAEREVVESWAYSKEWALFFIDFDFIKGRDKHN